MLLIYFPIHVVILDMVVQKLKYEDKNFLLPTTKKNLKLRTGISEEIYNNI